MEGLSSSKVTQRQDGIENSSRILLCHSLLPFLQRREPPLYDGKIRVQSRQWQERQTLRVSVSLGLCGLWAHE